MNIYKITLQVTMMALAFQGLSWFARFSLVACYQKSKGRA